MLTALVEVAAVLTLLVLGTAALIAGGTALAVRAQRRRTRARLEAVLDRLADEVAVRLAAGRPGGAPLARYERLAGDLRSARTWRRLQRLLMRERLLDRVADVTRLAACDGDPAARARAVVAQAQAHLRLRVRTPGAPLG